MTTFLNAEKQKNKVLSHLAHERHEGHRGLEIGQKRIVVAVLTLPQRRAAVLRTTRRKRGKEAET
jgi:hypothetical protein